MARTTDDYFTLARIAGMQSRGWKFPETVIVDEIVFLVTTDPSGLRRYLPYHSQSLFSELVGLQFEYEWEQRNKALRFDGAIKTMAACEPLLRALGDALRPAIDSANLFFESVGGIFKQLNLSAEQLNPDRSTRSEVLSRGEWPRAT